MSVAAIATPDRDAGAVAGLRVGGKWHDAVIRVIVADELVLVRRRLHVVLGDEPDIEVMDEAADADQLRARARELVPDVVVLGPGLPPKGGPPAAAALAELVPGVQVVALASDEADHGLRAVRAGVTAFLPAARAPEQAAAVVRLAARRRPVLPTEVVNAVVAEYDRLAARRGSVRPPIEPPALSTAEREALLTYAGVGLGTGGADDVEAARRSAVVRNALDRLARHTRAEAVLDRLAPAPAV